MKHISMISMALPGKAASLLSKQYQLQNLAEAVRIAQGVADLVGLSKGDE
ncbi:MAG: hypothetical protein R6V12_06140 [Candidatus Hydrogenedentota bacterium]